MSPLISKAEQFVTNYLNENLDTTFVYHNIAHTQRVVAKVLELTEEIELTEDEKEQLIIAAWFHDTGFTKTIDGHEKEGVKIATDFLKSENASDETIKTVSEIILATQMCYEPKNKLEGLINPPVPLKSGSLDQVGLAENAAPNKSP